jgi:hypothetical protein
MKNLLPLVTLYSFLPTFMSVCHKHKQNIPDIWRGRFYLLPLHSEMLNNKNAKL